MVTLYTPAEVSRHNHEADIWMIIHGGVYNLTKFLQEHPGGEEVLLKLAGTDGTTCFDDMGHTMEAIQLRETYKIGEVSESATGEPPNSVNPPPEEVHRPKDESTEWMIQKDKPKNAPSRSYLPMFVGVFAVVMVPYFIFTPVHLVLSFFWR